MCKSDSMDQSLIGFAALKLFAMSPDQNKLSLKTHYGSTQFVVPPPTLVSAPRVALNCGLQTTSVPPKLPVTTSPGSNAPNERSSKITPATPLLVMVLPPKSKCPSESFWSRTPSLELLVIVQGAQRTVE